MALTSLSTKEALAFKAIRNNACATSTLNVKCLCIELDTVCAPPRIRHNAIQQPSSSGRERLKAVYDVTDSRRDGSGMNCGRMVGLNSTEKKTFDVPMFNTFF